jgi:hypothetical protein
VGTRRLTNKQDGAEGSQPFGSVYSFISGDWLPPHTLLALSPRCLLRFSMHRLERAGLAPADQGSVSACSRTLRILSKAVRTSA